MKPIFILSFLLIVLQLSAQGVVDHQWAQKIKDFKLQPVIGIQMWSSYTFGAQLYNPELGAYEAVDNRLSFQIRRTRLGVKGQPYPNLKFALVAALDLVGRDLLAGTEGGANNGGSPHFRLWRALVQWKISERSDGWHLTAGYFIPQIGRESISSALRVSSMEKSWSQNYLRRHLVGTGPGRTLGLNLGGLFLHPDVKLGWSYDLGVFNPVFQSAGGNSTGPQFSPLLVGRVALHLGDPEFKHYSISHKINYFGKRHGLTLGLAVARQGHTAVYVSNQAYSLDVLLNWGPINFSGEWSILARENRETTSDKSTRMVPARAQTGFLRLGYNIHLQKSRVLEPVLSMVRFSGALDSDEQADAIFNDMFAGQDHYWEANLNFHFNPDLRLSMSYTFRQGDLGAALPGADFNNFFRQGGLGAIQRGDWMGLGLVAIF